MLLGVVVPGTRPGPVLNQAYVRSLTEYSKRVLGMATSSHAAPHQALSAERATQLDPKMYPRAARRDSAKRMHEFGRVWGSRGGGVFVTSGRNPRKFLTAGPGRLSQRTPILSKQCQ